MSNADAEFARELARLTGEQGYLPNREDLRRVAAMVQRVKAQMYRDAGGTGSLAPAEQAGRARDLLAEGDLDAALPLVGTLADAPLRAPLLAAIAASQAMLGGDAVGTFRQALADAWAVPGQAARYRLVLQVLGEAVATPVAAEVFLTAVAVAAAMPAAQFAERDGLLLAIVSMQRASDLEGALVTARRIEDLGTRAAALAEVSEHLAGSDEEAAGALAQEALAGALQLPEGPEQDLLLRMLARCQGGPLGNGDEALAIARRIGGPEVRAQALADLGLIRWVGEAEPATAIFVEALQAALLGPEARQRDLLALYILKTAGQTSAGSEVARAAAGMSGFSRTTIARIQAGIDVPGALATARGIPDHRERVLLLLAIAANHVAPEDRETVYKGALDSLGTLLPGPQRQDLERAIVTAQARAAGGSR